MKRMIMSFAVVLSLVSIIASAQSKDITSQRGVVQTNNNNLNNRDNTRQMQGVDRTTTGSGIAMNQDTSRRKKDTLRTPQPVPPVPMPQDTARKK